VDVSATQIREGKIIKKGWNVIVRDARGCLYKNVYGGIKELGRYAKKWLAPVEKCVKEDMGKGLFYASMNGIELIRLLNKKYSLNARSFECRIKKFTESIYQEFLVSGKFSKLSELRQFREKLKCCECQDK
jgi:hypothetical protein